MGGERNGQRRGFEHLFAEIAVALGRLPSRWDLWLELRGLGLDPEQLSREDLRWLSRAHLGGLVAQLGGRLSPPALRRLRRRIGACDPGRPAPHEWLGRLGSPR